MVFILGGTHNGSTERRLFQITVRERERNKKVIRWLTEVNLKSIKRQVFANSSRKNDENIVATDKSNHTVEKEEISNKPQDW